MTEGCWAACPPSLPALTSRDPIFICEAPRATKLPTKGGLVTNFQKEGRGSPLPSDFILLCYPPPSLALQSKPRRERCCEHLYFTKMERKVSVDRGCDFSQGSVSRTNRRLGRQARRPHTRSGTAGGCGQDSRRLTRRKRFLFHTADLHQKKRRLTPFRFKERSAGCLPGRGFGRRVGACGCMRFSPLGGTRPCCRDKMASFSTSGRGHNNLNNNSSSRLLGTPVRQRPPKPLPRLPGCPAHGARPGNARSRPIGPRPSSVTFEEANPDLTGDRKAPRDRLYRGGL